MADKLRGALFNIIGGEIQGARVLDLYAGTGALAIEALSRGAASADLVDTNPEALALIKANLEHTGFTEAARVWRGLVDKTLPRLPGGYDVVLADPPYADRDVVSLLRKIGESGLVREQGLVAIEHPSRTAAPDEVSRLRLLKHRRHGDAVLSLYRVVSDEVPL